MPRPAITAYDRIRKKWRGGQVVAEAVAGRCSACQILLRPQYLQDLRKASQLMFCESCGRILYYNPPVSFEDAATVQVAPVFTQNGVPLFAIDKLVEVV